MAEFARVRRVRSRAMASAFSSSLAAPRVTVALRKPAAMAYAPANGTPGSVVRNACRQPSAAHRRVPVTRPATTVSASAPIQASIRAPTAVASSAANAVSNRNAPVVSSASMEPAGVTETAFTATAPVASPETTKSALGCQRHPRVRRAVAVMQTGVKILERTTAVTTRTACVCAR